MDRGAGVTSDSSTRVQGIIRFWAIMCQIGPSPTICSASRYPPPPKPSSRHSVWRLHQIVPSSGVSMASDSTFEILKNASVIPVKRPPPRVPFGSYQHACGRRRFRRSLARWTPGAASQSTGTTRNGRFHDALLHFLVTGTESASP